MWEAADALSRIPPFNKPPLSEHILANSEAWQQFIFQKDSDNFAMPGPYSEVEAHDKKQRASVSKDRTLKDIKEVPEEKENLDDIWKLDEAQESSAREEEESEISQDEFLEKPPKDDTEFVVDSLVEGVGEYNEFRLGSVRFEKEMLTRKA